MSYFEDVYLKRMNKEGTTIQERVKTRKENEFDRLFLQKTKYQAAIYQLNDDPVEILSSLQPNKWNQDKIVSNLLVSTHCQKFKAGDIVRTFQKNKEIELDKIWLVMFVNEDITHGYQKYEVIELDETINYCDEYGETIEVIPVKFVSETSVYVQDKFNSYGAVSYREPLAHRKFITRDYDFLKKELYFDYKDRGWEIAGIDNLSIEGVAYISIQERLKREPEPETSKDIVVGDNDNFFLQGR